jgi:ribose 5-phosphate isomerase B
MGMCIAANKVPGVRAAVCDDELMAEMSRRYLDANVICLSAHLVSEAMIARMIAIWIKTSFEGGRHARRLDKLSLLEQETQPHACGTCPGNRGAGISARPRGMSRTRK